MILLWFPRHPNSGLAGLNIRVEDVYSAVFEMSNDFLGRVTQNMGGGSRAGYNRSASMLHLYMERLLCGNFCFFVTAAL